jgi:hypothetical protein
MHCSLCFFENESVLPNRAKLAQCFEEIADRLESPT